MKHAVVIVGLMSSMATAQDVQQTPEGAQRFLQQAAGQYEIRFDPARSGMSVAYRVSFLPDAKCATQVTGTPIGYYTRNGWVNAGTPGFRSDKVDETLKRFGVSAPPYRLDWQSVSAIDLNSPDGWPKVVSVAANGRLFSFSLPDTSIAKRMQYAMQFLKEACDKTAETGF